MTDCAWFDCAWQRTTSQLANETTLQTIGPQRKAVKSRRMLWKVWESCKKKGGGGNAKSRRKLWEGNVLKSRGKLWKVELTSIRLAFAHLNLHVPYIYMYIYITSIVHEHVDVHLHVLYIYNYVHNHLQCRCHVPYITPTFVSARTSPCT